MELLYGGCSKLNASLTLQSVMLRFSPLLCIKSPSVHRHWLMACCTCRRPPTGNGALYQMPPVLHVTLLSSVSYQCLTQTANVTPCQLVFFLKPKQMCSSLALNSTSNWQLINTDSYICGLPDSCIELMTKQKKQKKKQYLLRWRSREECVLFWKIV